ncbi:hypothetical protein [Prosthecomicrobium hirschii]|uniref:hypothetical protein n=1 Tax=Prosthecodimorpha hirschii TaxID=665126 RepID=UPI00221FDE08|nr:hypothetical protein [Prosthecomicrobium hirschii]MCW1844119.1 hypothetical protein [Prosthecomicrobium hirschii]
MTGVIASTTATTVTITIPSSGVMPGDTAILMDSGRITTGTGVIPDDIVPTGWTRLAGSSGLGDDSYGARINISYRVLTAADIGMTISGMNPDTRFKSMLVVRGDVVLEAICGALNYQITTGDPTLQTVTPPVAAYPILVVGGQHLATNGVLTMSPAGTVLNTGVSRREIRYSLAEAGAAVTTTYNTPDTGAWHMVWSLWIGFPPRSEASIPPAKRAEIGMIPNVMARALAEPSVVMAYAARMFFDDGTLRLFAGYGEISVFGETFYGVTDPTGSRLVKIEQIDDPRPGVAGSVRVGLVNADIAMLRAMQVGGTDFEGRRCDILMIVWDTVSMVALCPPVNLTPYGRMTSARLQRGKTVREVSFEVEGLWSARNFAVNGTLNPSDQNRRFPTDKACDKIGNSVGVRWPAS